MATNSNTIETIRKSSGEVQSALRKDINELRGETAEFSEGLLHAGSEHLQHAKENLHHQVENVSKYIQEKPGQSVAIAFAAGLLASLILGGRR